MATLIERDVKVSEVYKTQNYNQFKTLLGNRQVNLSHVFQLKQSMHNNHLFSPILVNEKMEIIDGQHRFNACRELNLPVYYIVVKGYGLEQVKILNTHMKNWQKKDYLNAYCDLGHPEYLKFREFITTYPMFKMKAAECILRNKQEKGGDGYSKDLKSKSNPDGRYTRRYFENGELVIANYELAVENAEKILDVEPFFNKFNNHVFVGAMINIFKNGEYDHDVFLSKLALNPTMMQPCVNMVQYYYVIEDIYNFRSRKKVNLRYNK